MFDLEHDTIVKIELDYDSVFSGLNLHVGNSPTNDVNGKNYLLLHFIHSKS
jgi:hypothetical protein